MGGIVWTPRLASNQLQDLSSDNVEALTSHLMFDITFRQLEVFVQIVEAGSFRGCAERLSISQVSISAHMKALEKHLGFELFQRKRGATAALTEAGEATYRRAKDLLQARADLVRANEVSARHDVRRKLRIAAHGYIAERFSKRLAEFVACHPEIEIELERRPFEGVLEGLTKSDIEIGFFLSHGPVSEIDSVRAWQEEVAFYVGRNHPLAEQTLVSPADLSRFSFYYLPDKSHLRSQMNWVLGEVDIRGCPIALISDDHVLITESLSDGKSFACLFTHGTDDLVQKGSLKRLRLSRPPPSLDVRYVVRAPYQSDPTTHGLTSCLSAPPT